LFGGDNTESRSLVDFGLRARVVWIFGATSPAVWDLVEAFLGEKALVRLVTTRGPGWALGRRLQLHAGRNLRVVTATEPVGLVLDALLPPLLDAGAPDVIVLVRSAGPKDHRSSHEWDQLLLSGVAELRAEATVVVVNFDLRTALDSAETGEDALARAHQSHQTWSQRCRADCAVSVIASSLDPLAATGRLSPRRVRKDDGVQGLGALAIFMASLGRGRTAMVTEEGSVHLV
jgi:hypothetical protein